jgi:hypothetical protein
MNYRIRFQDDEAETWEKVVSSDLPPNEHTKVPGEISRFNTDNHYSFLEWDVKPTKDDAEDTWEHYKTEIKEKFGYLKN